MQLRLVACVLATLGGVVLLTAGVLALTGDRVAWHEDLARVGYGLALAALVVVGYLIVATAPAWLRIIVAVCFPLLAASVWLALVPSVEDASDKERAFTWLAGGVIALLVAVLQGRAHASVEPGSR